jgi:hypothetical protein
VGIGETSSRRSRLSMRLLVRADRPGGWKVFESSGGFRLPDCSVLNPAASLLRLKRWQGQALTAEQSRGFAPVVRFWWLPGRRDRRRGQASTAIVIAERWKPWLSCSCATSIWR